MRLHQGMQVRHLLTGATGTIESNNWIVTPYGAQVLVRSDWDGQVGRWFYDETKVQGS